MPQRQGRKIIHVDMDCFYAAVEVKYRPELKGKALGIGGPANSRSVLCTASYEARKYKVRAAMPSSMAMRLCPHLILIPPNFPLYKKESQAVRKILERYTDKIEPLSLDEAYLDVSDCKLFNGSATLIAQQIRKQIREELNLTASAGIAPNKSLAKVASDLNKPDGQFVIAPHQVEKFVLGLEVEKIFGVGKVTAMRMHELGLFTCGDIQKHSLSQLKQWFGSRGEDLYNLARGIDHREVQTSSERKSLTVEQTYNQDLMSLREVLSKIPELYEDCWHRMQRSQSSNRISTVIVKLKFSDFQSTTHQVSCSEFPKLSDFQKLLTDAWQKFEKPVRLIGLGVRFASMTKKAGSQLPQLSFAI